MSRALIVIGLLLLPRAWSVDLPGPGDIVYRLGYNPTDDLWYFSPAGQPDRVSENGDLEACVSCYPTFGSTVKLWSKYNQ